MHRAPCTRRRVALAAFALSLSLAIHAPGASARDLLLFAAASTADAVNAAIHAFDSRGVTIRASYASSGALARQIDKGAPAHLYLSANEAWMDWADKRNLLQNGSITRLFGSRLVLIAPRETQVELAIGPEFPLVPALGDSRLAIADPAHVPAGSYARAALRHLKVWDAVAERTARAQDVRAALALVERAEASLGIVYRTDALASKKIRIVDTFPESAHPPIVYTLAVVAGNQSTEVRAFYDFLRSREAAAIFARYGFQPGR